MSENIHHAKQTIIPEAIKETGIILGGKCFRKMALEAVK